MSKFIKNNSSYIEKKILEYYLEWDSNSAERVFEIRHRLNKCNWFEEYIKYYYNSKWYKIKPQTWWCNPDWWIDLRWDYNWKKVYIQCKKYRQTFISQEKYSHIENKWYIWISNVRDFFWWVVNEWKWCIWNNIEMIFVTTWRYSKEAIKFAKDNNIQLKDFRDISRISKKYSLDDFLYDYESNWWDINRIINKNYKKEPAINKNQLTIDDINTNDLYNYFKNIIPELNWKEWIRESLNDFIKERNSNWWLQNFYKKHCNKETINILEKKEKEISKWLQIFYN